MLIYYAEAIFLSLKSKILCYLEVNKDSFVSGESLANEFSVSRNAVWKAINSLKTDGYKIESVTNKGYRLCKECDIISKEGILQNLKHYIEIFAFEEVDSTNNAAKLQLAGGLKCPALFVARKQTNGRGRRGRQFDSPADTGIYMSLCIKTNITLDNAGFITTAACVAVLKAIKSLTNQDAKIKWVNDIYLNNKKIVGILTEAVSDLESNSIENIIVGIGINTDKRSFPDELKEIAGYLDTGDISKNQLIAKVSDTFFEILEQPGDYLDYYRENSLVLGKKIICYENNECYEATALDINDKGELIILSDNNQKKVLNSGEITIRLKK